MKANKTLTRGLIFLVESFDQQTILRTDKDLAMKRRHGARGGDRRTKVAPRGGKRNVRWEPGHVCDSDGTDPADRG